jgi:hypothetical protein
MTQTETYNTEDPRETAIKYFVKTLHLDPLEEKWFRTLCHHLDAFKLYGQIWVDLRGAK